jgi:predicted NBD/HSP70 family sugar kinase
VNANLDEPIYIGVDMGATTTKVAAVTASGHPVTRDLLQNPTDGHLGPQAVAANYVKGIQSFLEQHGLQWHQVIGVGLATPGTFLSDGVLGEIPNLPQNMFHGVNIRQLFEDALAQAAGRRISVFSGNDGNLGGLGEAFYRTKNPGQSALCLMQGSGLGGAYIGTDGLPITGDHFAGAEFGHGSVPLHLFNLPPRSCGCGRDWGCAEVYTTISGLGHLLTDTLERFPRHKLAGEDPEKAKFQLRGLAVEGDGLAREIFGLQARVMGVHIAGLMTSFDAGVVVIGGGLIDPESTTEEFRRWYLNEMRIAAMPYLWSRQQEELRIVEAELGELSQAIGAALLARQKLS